MDPTGTFEAFFREQRDPLFRALCTVSRCRADAEEIVQEAFLIVWERWDRVSTMDRPDGYLFRTALNLFRRRSRRQRLADGLPSTLQIRDDLVAIEQRNDAALALGTLTRTQRDAVVLSAWFGYTTAETAKILGCRPSTVRVHLSRARSTFRGMPAPSAGGETTSAAAVCESA